MSVILAGSVLGGCVKPEEFPVEPYLEFRQNIFSYEADAGGDTVERLAVEFYFQDGDGDIGRKTEEEVEPYVGEYFHNLHFNLLEVLPDSSLVPVYMRDSLGIEYPISYNYHLHYIEPINADGTLKGTVTWQVDDFSSTAFFMQGKTVCYGIYLYDRALHKSNVIYTSPIIL
ncbi:MAG: hypothetical protein K2O66_04065 [Bacteroidales bacterium]|nr:hypothetical protein [Bacteroidales bacterium]MDE7072526.1 hypothetical protein [Bacteroidales bacterium]